MSTCRLTFEHIADFFAKYGKLRNKYVTKHYYNIASAKFDDFYVWYHGICYIIKDLINIYLETPRAYKHLFFSRNLAEMMLNNESEKTFLLRLSTNVNGLGVTYRKGRFKIMHVLLTRIDDGLYKIGSSNKQMQLKDFVLSFEELRMFYAPNVHINKVVLFAHLKADDDIIVLKD